MARRCTSSFSVRKSRSALGLVLSGSGQLAAATITECVVVPRGVTRKVRGNPVTPMMHTLMSLNYVAVVVVAIAGFLLGWLWYSPLLFAKPWMAEMKFTKESMEACKPKMASMMGRCLAYTLLSTLGLAALVSSYGSTTCLSGAKFGGFVGALIVGTRLLNGSLWEARSTKLQLITVGHEVALFTVQGAILACWR